MKKFTAILMMVLMIVGLFVSCNNNTPVIDETVSVIFDESIERSLTASLETFNKAKLYWTYTASKNDGGLSSGATSTEVWIHEGKAGLSGEVPGFSQGEWSFTLYGYLDAEGTKLAYNGTNNKVVLKRGGSNKVTVFVSPVKDENANGTLVIDSSKVTFVPQKSGDTPLTLTQSYKVTSLDGNTMYPLAEGKTNEWTLKPGAYKVTVDFINGDIVYGTGNVVATVYSNLKTTVSGKLVELLTYAEFDSSLNPDVITKTVSSAPVTYDEEATDPVKIEKVGSKTETKVVASVPVSAVNSYISSVVSETEGATTDNTSVVFSLSVNTTEASAGSVGYDINMSAVVSTLDSSGTSISEVTKQIKNLSDPVTVVLQLQTGLSNVQVTHNGVAMGELSSTNAIGYAYDPATGKLTIKTDSFSPFAVTYTMPDYYEASINDVKFTTLAAAVSAAKSGDTIKLINDVKLTETVTVDKGITIKLNGYNVIGDNVRAFHFTNGQSTITGSGIIRVEKATDERTPISVGSSVIRVGAGDYASWSNTSTSDTTDVKLSITYGPIIEAPDCYGITVMGNTNEELYLRDSKVYSYAVNDDYDGSAISTNGSDKTPAKILLGDYTEVYSEKTNAVYLPSSKDFAVASAKVTGATGIYVKSGKVEFRSGAEIRGIGEKQDYVYYGNGGIPTGDALVVDNCGYPNGVPEITLKYGTFISDNANAIGSYATEGNSKVTGFVTGGSFSSDPTEFLADGVIAGKNIESDKWIANPEAKIINETTEKYYRYFSDAIDNAAEGDTVVLLKDLKYSFSGGVVIKNSVTIDGNNKTLKCNFYNDYSAIKINSEGVIVTIKNLKIDTNKIGIWSNAKNVTLNLENSVIENATHFAITHNGSYSGFVLNANGSTFKSTTACPSIYISGSNTFTNHQQLKFKNCTIEGSTGIEGKYTDMTLVDCTVKATADYKFVHNGSGSCTDGFAVVITDNSPSGTTPSPKGTVTIDGGTYTGLVGLKSGLTSVEPDATYIYENSPTVNGKTK